MHTCMRIDTPGIRRMGRTKYSSSWTRNQRRYAYRGQRSDMEVWYARCVSVKDVYVCTDHAYPHTYPSTYPYIGNPITYMAREEASNAVLRLYWKRMSGTNIHT